MRATLRLIRFPLFITALADSAAGYLMAGGAPDPWTWVLLAGTSAFLYCGGMALNDLADLGRDKTLHPTRPLPSGAVTPGFAAALGLTLLAAGLGCAAAIGGDVPAAAGATALMILLYDFALKRFAVAGSMAMGLARAGNMASGMAAAASFSEIDLAILVLPLVPALYVFHLTVLSTLEEGKSELWIQVYLFLAPGVIIMFPWLVAPERPIVGTIVTAIMLATLLRRAWILTRRPTASEISATVGLLVLGIIPLDALLVLGRGSSAGFLAILALLPFALLARWSFKHV